MFGFARLQQSEHQPPFWLSVALPLMLLVSVPMTTAQAANPARLAHELRRDLSAVRAQLELIDPSERDAGRQTVTFNTDLGDGGPAFQRHSMLTIAGAANRRLERLLDGYREQGDEARAGAAEAVQVAMYDLQRQIDQMARAADPAEAAAVRERIVTSLDRCERELSVLLDATAQRPAHSEVTAQDAAAADAAPMP
jgi:type VI protein secretion system component VasF